MQTQDFGKVTTVFLKDQNNLPVSNGQKKIFVYTPSGYDASDTSKRYKVMYFFDGQNAFSEHHFCDSYPAPMFGSWQCDIAVKQAQNNGKEGIIIVGIDNGTASDIRDSELTQSSKFGRLTPLGAHENGSFASGVLEQTGKFLVQTVMPFVNANYNVKTDANSTFICGSSSGGIASFYVGLVYDNLFGAIGAFSPATGLFYVDSWQQFLLQKDLSKITQKIYIYCGKNSTDTLENVLYDANAALPNQEPIASAVVLKQLLVSCGYNKALVTERFVDGAIHHESAWQPIFTEFLSTLLD